MHLEQGGGYCWSATLVWALAAARLTMEEAAYLHHS